MKDKNKKTKVGEHKSNPLIYEINRIQVPEGVPKVHTDASFKNGVGSYAFMVRTQEGIYLESDTVPEEWLSESSRSCELYGTLKALQYCLNKGYEQVGLFFDYIGIYNLQIYRKGDPEVYKKYADRFRELSQEIDIYFHKVEGPSDFHDFVDLVSRANVRLSLGGEERGKYRQLISARKTTHKG